MWDQLKDSLQEDIEPGIKQEVEDGEGFIHRNTLERIVRENADNLVNGAYYADRFIIAYELGMGGNDTAEIASYTTLDNYLLSKICEELIEWGTEKAEEIEKKALEEYEENHLEEEETDE